MATEPFVNIPVSTGQRIAQAVRKIEQLPLGSANTGDALQSLGLNHTIVNIRNDSGEDVDGGKAMAISPIIDLGAYVFSYSTSFSGTKPSVPATFAITTSPIKAGAWGHGIIEGYAIALVDFQESNSIFCGAVNGSFTMQSGWGNHYVIWGEGYGTNKYALLHLNHLHTLIGYLTQPLNDWSNEEADCQIYGCNPFTLPPDMPDWDLTDSYTKVIYSPMMRNLELAEGTDVALAWYLPANRWVVTQANCYS